MSLNFHKTKILEYIINLTYNDSVDKIFQQYNNESNKYIIKSCK